MKQLLSENHALSLEIAERKKVEEALRESEQKYRTLVENSLQGITIAQDFRVVFCNQTFANLFGYCVDEILAMDREQILALLEPSCREMMYQRHLDRLEGKDVPNRYEYRAVKRDGTGIWVDVFVTLMEYQGKPAVQATYLDITDRKEAEQKIRASKEHLDAILNHISDPIFVMDREHRIMHANDAGCAFGGMRREDILGRALHKYAPEELRTAMWQQEAEVFNTGKECITEENIRDARGDMHSLITKKSLLIDQNGNKQLVGVSRDITEYKSLQAQLLQAQKMEAMGVLANGIATDFNNLLSVMKGYVDVVLEERTADTALRRDLENVTRACLMGEKLTAQLLAFSPNRKPNTEIINLNEILHAMNPVIRRLIGEAVELEILSDVDLGFIHADPGQVRQLITNLVLNAQAAMPDGGKLTIETENIYIDESLAARHPGARTGFYVTLAIRDNGIGMDDTVKAHMFDPFFTTKDEGKGTGLGLSAVYGIVKQCQGFIDVESEPGKGAKLLIHFPCEC